MPVASASWSQESARAMSNPEMILGLWERPGHWLRGTSTLLEKGLLAEPAPTLALKICGHGVPSGICEMTSRPLLGCVESGGWGSTESWART